MIILKITAIAHSLWLIFLSLHYFELHSSLADVKEHLSKWSSNDNSRPSDFERLDQDLNYASDTNGSSSDNNHYDFMKKTDRNLNESRENHEKLHITETKKHIGVKSIRAKRKTYKKSENRIARKTQQGSTDVQTKCILISHDNSTFVKTFGQNEILNGSPTFTLDFELVTDKYASEMDWYFFHQMEENNLLIDSKRKSDHNIELAPSVENKFKYSCFVTHKEQESQISAVDMKKSNVCYTFAVSDDYGDGICCWGGSGHYALKLNETVPLVSGRFYAHVAETKFCLNDDGSSDVVDENELLYPSRQCLNEVCVCDSKPKLLSNSELENVDQVLRKLKVKTFANILTLSGTESLKDTNSAQYMAACWTLNDDPYLPQYGNITAEELDAETRIMQRYILAVHYFATKPQNWSLDLKFLSSLSECEWTAKDEDNDPLGIGCDEKKNIISFLFDSLNLDGVLVDELSGLESLEFLAIVEEPKLTGSIPSSFELLSELRYLALEDIPLVSTIPPELFNAKKMERLMIVGTLITGTIPPSISKTNGMQVLRLRGNHLTGEIPEELYSLTQLRQLILYENEFSSTISSSIGSLKDLKILRLDQNHLSGSLPSEIGRLLMLEEMTLNENKFTSTVPSTLKFLSNAKTMSLNNNNFEGEVPDAICKLKPLPDVRADCRNDIFPPDLKCSCCSYCVDLTPSWNGKCPDSKLKIVIDHIEDGDWFNSELLEWSITDTATNKKIMGDKYMKGLALKPEYERCVASTDCLSLNMTTGAIKSIHDYPEFSRVGFETTYSIYWNDNLLITDTVASDMHNSVIHPEVIIQHDYLVTNQVQEADNCVKEEEMICSGEAILLNPKQRVMYNNAIRVSGIGAFDNVDSDHSKALCWIINNESLYEDTDFDQLEALSTQRYVLALLHLTSEKSLFVDGEYPPPSHECKWEGVECDGKTMTSLSFSSASKRIIGGSLIEEIGSLAFLEILNLSEMELTGSIPSVLSNLYSLKELDLSGNELSGSMPKSFFDKLEKLELLDLSNNKMYGEIPVGIGSSSSIKVIRLNNNKFNGILPLDKFTKFDLKHINVNSNLLSGSISPLLLRHTNLEYIDVSNNIFIGELSEDTFIKLTGLKYFDVSQNEFTGSIPPGISEISNITHLDLHSNQFSGTIPTSITKMLSLNSLTIQGNKLIGNIPSGINNLKKLTILALSHNHLSGPINLDLQKLPDLNKLYLHSNHLSGEAPKSTNNNMESYITDCGHPKNDPTLVCPSCSICCNSNGECQKQITSATMKPAFFALILIFTLIVITFLFYLLKSKVINSSYLYRYFEEKVAFWRASELIYEKSVYNFMLVGNEIGWWVGVFCVASQLATLFIFIVAADTSNKDTDMIYTMTCPPNSLDCEDTTAKNFLGYFIFTLLLTAWLLKDIVNSSKLMLLSLWDKNIDFFFTSSAIFIVTIVSASTSIYYNLAIATKNTEMIENAVILLFVNELDERLFQLAEVCHFTPCILVDESLEMDSNSNKRELVLYRSLHKFRKRLRSYLSQKKSEKEHPQNGDSET